MVGTNRVVVIGAGIGGLSAAICLAAAGCAVTVLERASAPGGKMRQVSVAGMNIDAGPTVFTLRRHLDAVFAAADRRLEDHITLRPASLLARHAWSEHERLDLFADIDRSTDAIGRFAGAAEARGYRRFCDDARRVFAALDRPFMQVPQPSLPALVKAAGLAGAADMLRANPFGSLWDALGRHFADPRLRQLFGRYATYLGSSPFLAPATLMLVAHAEQAGVWLIEGGMHRLARAMAELAEAQGVTLRFAAEVARVRTERGRVSGVVLADGEAIAADAVVANADASALGAGLFGPDVTRAAQPVAPAERSLSAVTWCRVARTEGFPLVRHTVFFSSDYAAEFDDIVKRRRLPRAPTVYVCAQDRGADADDAGQGGEPSGPERLLLLVNAPPVGDTRAFGPDEVESCAAATFDRLARCGLTIDRDPTAVVTTTPADFARLFPGTGGALYGRASHGWQASFQRPGVRTRLAGLYLAGGSVHPGPGVPMAALSGRLAAACVLADAKR